MSDERDRLLESVEREIGVVMRRARRMITVRAALVHPDLSPASYLLLGLLWDKGPLRASAVSELLTLDKGAVSRQVQHLVDLGLVERSTDPDDRRAVLLDATDAARERMALVVESRRARFRERMGEWDDQEMADFVAVLRRYNAALDELDPDPGC